MSRCEKLDSTYRDSIHRREVTILELKWLRSTSTHQSLNTLQRADKNSTVGICFLRSRLKQSLITPWELSAQQRGNREHNLEMHSRIKNTQLRRSLKSSRPETEILRLNQIPAESLPLTSVGFLLGTLLAAAYIILPSTPQTLLFPRQPCLCSNLKYTAVRDWISSLGKKLPSPRLRFV